MTFTYSIGSTKFVGRLIKIKISHPASHPFLAELGQVIVKLSKYLGVNVCEIISIDTYNSSDAVYFDKLIDYEKI